MTRPAVLFGGPSDEHDISILTGLQVARALGDITAVYWTKSGEWFQVDPGCEASDFADGLPRGAHPLRLVASPGGGFTSKRKPLQISAAVLALHGGPGEDGTLQGVLDLIGPRYTGPGQAASAMGMDKFVFGAAMAAAGLPTLPRVLALPDFHEAPPFDPPYIVKPRFGGSSIGIEVVSDWDTARALVVTSPHMASGAVVEPFLAASRDLQVAVRTHPRLEVSAIEAPVRSGDGDIYSYQQKYLAWGGEVSGGRELPASLDQEVEASLRELARLVMVVGGMKGVGRIDFLELDGELYVNEMNTIPGSMAAYLWIDPEIPRARLFSDMIEEALAGTPRGFSVAGSDGTALRSAGSIASKLG